MSAPHLWGRKNIQMLVSYFEVLNGYKGIDYMGKESVSETAFCITSVIVNDLKLCDIQCCLQIVNICQYPQTVRDKKIILSKFTQTKLYFYLSPVTISGRSYVPCTHISQIWVARLSALFFVLFFSIFLHLFI